MTTNADPVEGICLRECPRCGKLSVRDEHPKTKVVIYCYPMHGEYELTNEPKIPNDS